MRDDYWREAEHAPAEVGKSDRLGHARRSEIVSSVQIGRHSALLEDLARRLGDERFGESLASMGLFCADSDLLSQAVVGLTTDAGGIAALVVEHDQDVAIEAS